VFWGEKSRRKPLGFTIWDCPACGRPSPATVQLVESSFHINFIPLGYKPAGHSGLCHWCESESPIDPREHPTLAAGWAPGDHPDRLAAALKISVDPREFEAPPSEEQLLVLWHGMLYRGKTLGLLVPFNPDIKATLVACALITPLTVAVCLFAPLGMPGNLVVGLLSGIITGLALGLGSGAGLREMFNHPAYVRRRLGEVLGPGATDLDVRAAVRRLRAAYAKLLPLVHDGSLRVSDLIAGYTPPRRRWTASAAPPAPPAAPAASAPPPAAGQLTLACPHCGKGLKVKSALVGRTVRCPGCAKPFQIGEP
jgi:hypothetical protein